MLFISILRRNQMAKVYRIETPPKKTNFHKPATMNVSAPLEQGRVFSKPREDSSCRPSSLWPGKNLGH
jgi:hypothetical protein